MRPNERAVPRVVSAGRISRRIPVDPAEPRRGQRNIGDVSLVNPDGALDFLITDYTLEGEKIRAWLAEPEQDASEWSLIYEATMSDVEATQTIIRISVTTIADELERPLQLRKYTGNGGLTGDVNVAGRLKPMAFGEVWGADPVLISAADNVYAVSDGPIQAIDWVREGGLDYDFTADHADYDALVAASLAAGEYATSLVNGLFKIGTNLPGLVYPIRVGLKGDNSGSGYVASTGTVLYRLARDRAFLGADQLDVESFASLPSGSVGYYANGAQDLRVADAFDALLGGVNGFYGVGRSDVLSVGRILPPEFVLTELSVRGDQVFDLRVEARPDTPRITQPYSWGPTWAPVGSADVSDAADESVRVRLQQDAFTGLAQNTGGLSLAPTVQPVLTTYFAEQQSALRIAEQALLFASTKRLPIRADLGRLGLLLNIGGCIAIESDRFQTDYRGIVYEQEDRLGAIIQTEVTALG